MKDGQQLARSALVAMGSLALAVLRDEDDMNKIEFVTRINDAASLVLNIYHSESQSQKAFIVPTQVKAVLGKTKLDKFLFGDNLKKTN